jgi:cell division protein FtsI (penicillin-binding protein 3)/stage V sporulation protein D (sporulation-specific penicillin-binding protein)
MVEPGSTFKIVTLAAAINEGLVSLEDVIDCERGRFFYANEWLKDTQSHGLLSVEEIMMKSSNIGFAKIALMLRADRLYDYAWRFGFGQRTQILHNQSEAAGILRPIDQWTKLSVTRVPIGQEVAATPIQMANAMCAIANGGRLMMPRIIKHITDSRGRLEKEYQPQVVRQVVSARTARLVSRALCKVVSQGGTALSASIKGFEGRVAGKTGTAQKFVDGSYSRSKYVASFIGYFPEEDPEVLILVSVDEPNGSDFYGGRVAAPWFSRIGDQIAEYLGIPRERKERENGSRLIQSRPLNRGWGGEITSYYNAEEYP